MNGMMRRLFTYGSLMCSDIMLSVAGACREVGPAVLSGYTRFRVKGEVYPAVVPREDATVEGVLYDEIDARALARLDAFEGEMYSRKTVSVRIGENEFRTAYTYVLRREFFHFATTETWSFDEFLRTGKGAFTEAYVGYSKLRG